MIERRGWRSRRPEASTSRCWCLRTAGARGGCWPQSRRRRQSNGCCGRWACRTRRRWWRRPGRRRVMRSGGEHEGDGRSGCEQGVVAGPGCVLGERVREERAAGRVRGVGLAGAYQGRIVVVVGFGWSTSQLVVPIPLARSASWSCRCPWLQPLVACGQMALTLYVAHVLFLFFLVVPIRDEIEGTAQLSPAGKLQFTLGAVLAFWFVALFGSSWWRRKGRRGPLEALMRRACRLTRPAPRMRQPAPTHGEHEPGSFRRDEGGPARRLGPVCAQRDQHDRARGPACVGSRARRVLVPAASGGALKARAPARVAAAALRCGSRTRT
jgi:hypothetical protein